MRKGIFSKLAVQNIRNNKSTYIPYMITCIFCIAMIYMMEFLRDCPTLDQAVRHAAEVRMILSTGEVVVVIFCVIFLIYSNSFLMKRRQKEIGLYNILGLERNHIGIVLLLETIFTTILSLTGGIAIGILASKLSLLLLLRLLHIPAVLGFYISTKGIITCLLMFGAIFLLILLLNLRRIHLSRPVELLRGNNTGEREPKAKWLMALLGFICLGIGYYLAITTESPIKAITIFLLAVILVMAGTYLLFTAGSIVILKFLRRRKSFYYKTGNFISISGMLYRMKQNAVGLANICILSTMVLVILSSTCSLWFGAEDMIHTRYPADVLVSMEDPNHMIDMDTFLTDELKSVPGGSYTSYEFLTGYDSTEETEDHSSAIFMKDGTAQVDSITRNVLFFSAETYNRITGENVTVEPGTALYMSVDGVPMPDTMTFAGTTYTLLPTPKSFNLRGRYHAYVSKPYVVVLPDYVEKSQVITPTEYYCISLGKLRDEEQQTFYDAIREDVTTIMPDEESVFWDEDGYFNFECRVENTKEIRSMYGSFLFMGISLGFVFTMAAVLIIYYKQISEGMEDKNRFAIMQQVGLSQKEVKHAIHTQILTVFFLPLITAGIHVMFAYPIIRAILRAMMLSSETVFITCTVASFLVFSVLYAVVYTLTAKVYYRIISEDNK